MPARRSLDSSAHRRPARPIPTSSRGARPDISLDVKADGKKFLDKFTPAELRRMAKRANPSISIRCIEDFKAYLQGIGDFPENEPHAITEKYEEAMELTEWRRRYSVYITKLTHRIRVRFHPLHMMRSLY